MHHIVQPTSLYGNLVSQHHHDVANGFGIAIERKSSSEIFRAMRLTFTNALRVLMLHPGVQHFQITLVAVVAILMMGIPVSGRAEEIAAAAVPAATESAPAEKADLIEEPETFNATAQTTCVVSAYLLSPLASSTITSVR